MTAEGLRRAGWFSIAGGVLGALGLAVGPLTRGMETGGAIGIQGGYSLVSIVVVVYVYRAMKRMFSEVYQFDRANRLIDGLIVLSIAMYAGAVARVGLGVGGLGGFLAVCLFVLVVVAGIAHIALARTLLGVGDGIGGLLRPYCVVEVVRAVCLLSI
ncbi:MAG: hypothetical protein JXQ73_14485, partial [Phycisphaerae bacterium]|nr:hypothetical protein [Phycisphaerae bacterium]